MFCGQVVKTILASALLVSVFVISTRCDVAYAASGVNDTSGRQRVLEGIPAIARAFAPVAGVDWKDFAKSLAGICAVESTCSPTYPHWVNGKWSQYQGLFQMNSREVEKAEAAIKNMLPQIRASAGNDPEQQKAVKFVEEVIQKGQSMSGDRRFHPEYGIVLGAAKHIQIHKQLEKQYPGEPVWQAAGHMTAQFAGVTEGKIRAGNFSAPISGSPYDGHSEAWALAQNRTTGRTVHDAINSAGTVFGKKMLAMMNQLNQVTNGLTGIPTVVKPFDAPAFNPGTGPILDEPYNAVSTLKETGYLNPNGTWNTSMYSPTPSMPTTPQSTLSQLTTGLKNLIQGEKPKAILSISARPQSVSKGDRVTLMWAAAGVTSGSCVVYDQKKTAIARGDEGSKTYTITASAESVLEFVLKCTDQSNPPQPVEEKTVISVDTYPSSSALDNAFSQNGNSTTGRPPKADATFDEILAQTLAQKNQQQGSSGEDVTLGTPAEYQGPNDDVRLIPADGPSGNDGQRPTDVVYVKSGPNTTFEESGADSAIVVDPTIRGATGGEVGDSVVLAAVSDVLKNIRTALNQIGKILLGR